MNTATPLAGRRVLVVEDRYLIAAEVCDEVTRLGGNVVGPSGQLDEARRLAEHEAVDLALLDVNLDGEPIYPVAEVLAERGVPFIFLTGYDDWILPEAWRERPRLQKPVSGRTLREEMQKIIA